MNGCQYDCINAPFQSNGVSQSWWLDRNSVARYFWAGSDSTKQNYCQCGIDGNCVDRTLTCNCDVMSSMALSDSGRTSQIYFIFTKFIALKNLKVFTFLGFISNKDFLPIKSLRFGGRSSVNRLTSGRHTLGRLECNGQVNATSQMPSSCLDLWLSGQTQTGFYSIKGSSQQIELVYCNMTKPKTNSGNNSLKLKR